jgi:adenosylcobinamide-GDP ribazoletransferase
VQILRIMKDSRVGTYALVGMVLVLHQKLHALAAFPLAEVAAVLVSAHCASRWTSIPLIYFCTYIQVGSCG